MRHQSQHRLTDVLCHPQDVLRASLQWETFEQYALWQLLNAHDLPLDCVLPLVKAILRTLFTEQKLEPSFEALWVQCCC